MSESTRRFSLKKLPTLLVLTLSLLLFAVAADAQEFHGAFGFGGTASPNSAATTFPSFSSGLYPSVSGIFILKRHIGFGGQVAWRAHQTNYGSPFQIPYRPVLYHFDAVYGRKWGKKFGADVMAGIGGLDLRYYTPSCGSTSCANYNTSSNNFAGHFGADIRYYFWGNTFIRPEIHYYVIRNNVEFNGANNFARFAVSIGYSFMPRSGL